MRFFIDTEFTSDDPDHLQLISIALVGEDASEFYAVSTEFDRSACSDWVVEHVLPHIEPRDHQAWMSGAQIRDGIVSFLGARAKEMWGYVPAYDWFLLHRLFGGWSKVPESFPRHVWDLKQWAWQLGVTEFPEQDSREHHALDDARWDRLLFEHLCELARARGLPAPT